MIVVADCSPMIVLVGIGHIDVLPRLFGKITIPPQVRAELLHPNRPHSVRDFFAVPHPWLLQRIPTVIADIPSLHAGELAAINLALELQADLLLIDEMHGRKAAADRKIPFAGTIGVLELAADRGFLDLQDSFERVKNTDFWISHDLRDERLQLHLARGRPR